MILFFFFQDGLVIYHLCPQIHVFGNFKFVIENNQGGGLCFIIQNLI